MDSEIRQNKATKQWVIFAPGRRRRPLDFKNKGEDASAPPAWDENCPFCPGREEDLGSIIMERPGPRGQGWQTRVVPNKYPALTPEGSSARYRRGLYLAMPGYGRHEVIIESPAHNRQPAQMTPEEVGVIIETYHRRYVDLMRQHGNMMTLIFRNHGRRAGTSLIHPHSQIIVTGMVPSHIRWREERAQYYFDESGRCVYCDILEFEAQDQRRIVAENETFMAFVPFAAEVPFEMWIMPTKHQACFGDLADHEKPGLAAILRQCLARLDEKIGDPDYNYVINSAARHKAGEPQLHWYLQIRPRLTTEAGFEIGSGISINPSLPEDDAAYLRRE